MAALAENPADSLMMVAGSNGAGVGAGVGYVAVAGAGAAGQIIPSGEPNM